MNSKPALSTNRCPRCAATFTCGMQAGEAACWCAAFPSAFAVPSVGSVDPALGCYCPRCLAELIDQKRALQGGAAATPAQDR
ncbi:cysteine-rich CWC family protein [Thauera mechernichensis]|uniref:Cysteine-rich CWC family protein n=2 Tax=Zoogloeaceae TaxID=2008794 RepID=A0ABW3WIC1_9RHOO|nr:MULTISPECIES: cysteine-rich CWC family protein [Thauera]ENO77056.1 hypothetical protein B447_16587 [Thauera sp. 27]MDG3063311.1 cysteine-rich CWC family protein [Thauera mechernichensis]